MDADSMSTNWRQKIEALKRLPRPQKPHVTPTHSASSSGTSSPVNLASPQLMQRRAHKDLVKLKLVTKREEDTRSEYWDLYGYNDILNPTISAEERFDKYLTEMVRMDRYKTSSPVKAGRSATFLPELNKGDTPRPKLGAIEPWETKSLDLGSRGGGWRMLPKINKTREEDLTVGNKLKVSVSIDTVSSSQTQTHFLPKGAYTAR